MTDVNESTTRWLDLSGAPPMLIPESLAGFWRGTTDRTTGEYREAKPESLVTDYDRACSAAWPGRSIVEFRGASVLVLYTEFDLHTWDAGASLVACGGWLPSDDQLREATWTDRIRWETEHIDFLLMNSAADAGEGLSDNDHLRVRLSAGVYAVEFSSIEGKSVGCFHRFTRETDVA